MLLHEFLTQSASRHPGNEAVVHLDRRLTYAELDRLSSAVAARLQCLGVGKGDRVALFAENSGEIVASFFGVLKAGATVVPWSAQIVQREISYLLEDCSPRVVITDARHAQLVEKTPSYAALRPQIVTVERLREEAEAAQGHAFSAPEIRESDCAAIVYTSGTTGKPKGIMLSHANLCANAESILGYLRLSPRDRILVVMPFCYSYGISLLTTHIRAAGTLVIDNRFLYVKTILDTMMQEKVTGFAGVPSHFALLLRKSPIREYRFSALRYLTQAGGAMSPALIREFTELLPDVKFYVMYGQTEASARLSYLEPEFLERKLGSVGKAVPGVELEIIKENGEQAQPRETGEIVARGKNIMLGYWNAPEETRNVVRERGLYTGDLAYKDEDGFIFIVSRKKDMIKSGSYRISPREIEDVVCAAPGVVECAAVGVPDEILGEAIHLFVVMKEGVPTTTRDILIFCKQNLAMYKLPKAVHLVPSLPKTASGKIKREELRASILPGGGYLS